MLNFLLSQFKKKALVVKDNDKNPKGASFRKISNLGKNEISLGSRVLFKGVVDLIFSDNAKNSFVSIGDNVELKNLKIEIKGSNCKLIIGDNVRFAGHILLSGNNRKVVIGEKTTAVNVYLMAREKDINIGKECMFSRGMEIRSSDVHKIYQLGETERLNKPGDVWIGDHVWIGAKVMISKGVTIPNGCIVGACSFVNKKFKEENSVIAGAPAKVVRKNIFWER